MKVKQRKCKNPKCPRLLPDGYEHQYCERCRNSRVAHLKSGGKVVLGLAVMVGGTAVTIATKGKINLTKKRY